MKPSNGAAPTELDPERPGTLHASRGAPVSVVHTAGHHHLVATRSIAAGAMIFRIDGELTSRPTRYSLQVGNEQHIDLDRSHSEQEILDRYFWRFMNHSCEPNAVIRDREVFAARDIGPGEEVSFDYNTTEWDMAEPFDCHCGSPACLGRIRGFRYLTPVQRSRLRVIAPHLVEFER